MSSAPANPHADADALLTLKVELEARVAEGEWLKAHYEEELQGAFEQIRELQERLGSEPAPPDPAPPEGGRLDELQREVARLSAAEACYLDRIEELKDALAASSDAKIRP